MRQPARSGLPEGCYDIDEHAHVYGVASALAPVLLDLTARRFTAQVFISHQVVLRSFSKRKFPHNFVYW